MEDRLVFHQSGRDVELRHLGPAHTFGDAFVYLPKDKILFAGDLAFYYVTPLAFQGHVGNWIKVADRILKMDVDLIVPGHGPLGGKKELREMRSYLMLIRREARETISTRYEPRRSRPQREARHLRPLARARADSAQYHAALPGVLKMNSTAPSTGSV